VTRRWGTFNRRAEEILNLAGRAAVVGQDLRMLPSPLGDMLYETLAHGPRAAESRRSSFPLGGPCGWEVSTYPIRGDERRRRWAPSSCSRDRTAQKELAAGAKRQAEGIAAPGPASSPGIADEIKNPLVSINTFVELIDERYDDPDFSQAVLVGLCAATCAGSCRCSKKTRPELVSEG